MAIISDFEEDQKEMKPSPSPSSSAVTASFTATFDPSNPLGFLEKAVDFVAHQSDFLEKVTAEKEILSVVRAAKARKALEKKKIKIEEETKNIKIEEEAKKVKIEEVEEKKPKVSQVPKKEVKKEEGKSPIEVDKEGNGALGTDLSLCIICLGKFLLAYVLVRLFVWDKFLL
ncbi:protein BOBBER 2, partial [Morus notabilis]|uniref:protein BOBBER 2 n=1 Tax=Morus notabilis TaxID=981085 RepID=UPI000CED101E